ncbi:MAG: hypothetical protein OQL16_02795 [Gammaproteobacteria bacterium]|nr:hypothetical protein [Gammaproteobacteria bacterium]
MSDLSIFVSKLINDESAPASKVGDNIMHVIKTLMDIKAIDIRHYGRGARYVLKSRNILESYMRTYYPDDIKPASGRGVTSLAGKPAEPASAKRSLSQGMATASMRFFSGTLTYPDISVDANKMTHDLGVVSAQIYSDTPLRMECKKIGVVENLELFYYVEHLDETIDCALYAGERLHDALLDWLSTHGSEVDIIYFGAYSTSGVHEYIRLRDRLSANVSYYMPDNLDELFSNHVNRELLGNNIGDYRKISIKDDMSVKKIIDLMILHGGGLQQEVLLMGDE